MPEPVRIAIVGYGLVGKRHAEAIATMDDVALAAIVDNDEKAIQLAREQGVAQCRSIDELFAEDRPDGVLLATPTPLHVEQGMVCVAERMPVLIEKPIAVSARDALELVEAAEAKSVPLLVGHHRRHNGVVLAAKDAIDGGSIGELRSVQATCWLYKPDSYFEVAPWRAKKGAGPISVNLVHDVDLLRHFCGEAASVQAIATPARRGYENEDFAAAILRFAGGAVGMLSVSDSIAAPWSWELTAHENPAYPETDENCYLFGGSEGGLSLPRLRLWKHEGKPGWWEPISSAILPVEGGDPLVAQLRNFAAVIRGQQEPLVSGREGLRSLQVVEAIRQSADAEGATIEIQPY